MAATRLLKTFTLLACLSLWAVAINCGGRGQREPRFDALKVVSFDERLLSAVKNNYIDQVGILLGSGKIKNIDWIHGESLLKIAFDNHEFDIYRILLHNGADPNVMIVHKGHQQPIIEYLYRQSAHDTVGYFSIMIGALLDAGAKLDGTHFKIPLFVEILRHRVRALSGRGDLVFTNWLYLLYTIFNDECLDGNVIREANLAKCLDWMNELHQFFEEVQRNRIIELKVGDIRYFMNSFDLCPENDEKVAPNASGCG